MGLFDSKRSKSALAKDRKYFNASEKHEVDYATTFKRKKKTYDTFDNGGGVDEIQWTARAENTQTGEVVWFTDNIDAKTKQEAWDKAGSAIDWKNPEWRGFVLYDVKPNNPSELMKNGGGLKNPIESLPTPELAKKAGVTMADMNKHNLGREDLIAMITEGSYERGGFLGGLFKSKRSKSALSKDRKYYNASQEHEVQYAKSTGRNKKPYDSNDGRTYKKGLSYKLDRAKHNKSEDWEKPMSQRKSRFYNGGGVENSYVIRAKSGEFVTVGKNNEVARSGLGNNHNYATLFKSEKEANDVIEKINNEAPFPINPKTDKNIVLYAEKYQPTKYSNGGGVNDSDLEFRNGGTYTTNRITSRDEAVESFLTQSKPFSYTNISVNFTPDGKGFLFQYGTLIAKRTDDSVSINEVFYSKTTSILQNLIGRKASEKGMKVSKVTFLENGGGVEDKDWKDLAWERNAPYIRLALEKNASKIGERFNFHKKILGGINMVKILVRKKMRKLLLNKLKKNSKEMMVEFMQR
ncbi:MAG: hypothetical protein IPJ01_11960 [Micavibrio sp.]|nr:hypothetical protein [Micavibrio sp.]